MESLLSETCQRETRSAGTQMEVRASRLWSDFSTRLSRTSLWA